jgi:hypothetical protein
MQTIKIRQTNQGYILHNQWGLALDRVVMVRDSKRRILGWQNEAGVIFCTAVRT